MDLPLVEKKRFNDNIYRIEQNIKFKWAYFMSFESHQIGFIHALMNFVLIKINIFAIFHQRQFSLIFSSFSLHLLSFSGDLCRPLNCKKREICLLEDSFTAVCVSKKELHKNRSVFAESNRKYFSIFQPRT